MNTEPKSGKKNYLFTVDILVEGYSNGIALESLLHLLNQDKIKDYQIRKGIELGKQIEFLLEKGKNSSPPLMADTQPSSSAMARPPAAPPSKNKKQVTDEVEKIKSSNALIRLTVPSAKEGKLSIPCRILNFDYDTEMLTVYHVDEKKVYQFHLSEVEDLAAH
ncbi:hypothetical protein MJA45_20950 [Paenibacillus aurantius]|uniref:Uncharacterized protein n=1 Tax=Paenibacillus aurantius TaxID=2918900 RepID=A0AA96LAI1_9BACL|nr:hypothetical protein [Paenibacillus aurantius]WNQ10071.1 hypothetical protein MJA45_20950 [Paenibacillus aurantius]